MADGLCVKALDAIARQLHGTDREAPPETIDVGFSSVVVAFGASVVRVARTEHAREGHKREMTLLPWPDGRLGVDLPVPRALLAPSPALPFGAIVEPRLQGRVMTAADGRSGDTATKFGDVLARLHGVDSTEAPAGSVQHLDPTAYLRRVQRETRACLRTRISLHERTRLDARLRDAEELLPGHEQVLCHGDAWYGNALVDDGGHLAALLDFEDACLADPALDLAATMYLDPPGPERVLDAYLHERRPSRSLLARIEAYTLVRELAGLAYLLRNDIDDELEDGIEKVRAALDH